MIKKLLFITPIFLLSAAALQVDSNSAPASTSGAPGEVDCTTSGCHQSFTSNSGPGNTTISLENGLTNYIPGKTYTMKLEVNQPNLIRFGFQMVALKDKDNSNVGVFTATDGSRNQITTGYGNLADRKYITYTFKSTSAQTTGKGDWTFNWTAPAINEGPITFYAAAIAANNDGNDLGDYCYTKALSITPSQTNYTFNLNVFCNPDNNALTINYTLAQMANVKIEMVNSLGQNMQSLYLGSQAEGNYSQQFSLEKQYGKGVYFIRFTQDGKITLKKIILAQ